MSDVMDQGNARQKGVLRRLPGALRTLIVGALMCLTPPTSIIALGWLQGDMRRVALRRAGLQMSPQDQKGWLLGTKGSGWISRPLGGLAHNIRSGLNLATGLLVTTLPYAGFWLAAWWAGWENSFNKGYEQSVVGPLVGFGGVAIFVIVMIHLPMAIAHQAVEQRPLAFFELRRVRSALACSGWRYVWLAATTLFFALPIFASRGLPAFAEGIYPAIADMTPQEVGDLRFQINLFVAGYVFVSLVILRRWSARIYCDAVGAAGRTSDRHLWENSKLSGALTPADRKSGRRWRVFRGLRTILLSIIWTAVAFLIFFGQFLHHDWHVWLTHPYTFLPWTM